MKHTAYTLSMLILAAACAPDFMKEEDYPLAGADYGKEVSIECSASNLLEVGKAGDTWSGTFTCNLPWLAESNADWVVLKSARKGLGGSRQEPLELEIARNATLHSREAMVRIKVTPKDHFDITIRQEASTLDDLGKEWYIKPGASGSGDSWKDAADFSTALSLASNGDKLYLAAGTYAPGNYAGGTADANRTFLVTQNVKIYGGYPADPKDGDKADPAANRTILDGGNAVNHVMVLAVPKDEDFTVLVSGLEIINGKGPTGAGSAKINGAYFYLGYGAGVYVAGTTGKMEKCIISDHTTSGYACGVWVTHGSDFEMVDCEVSRTSNSGTNYGNAVQNGGTLTMRRCRVVNNQCTGGAASAIYNYDSSAGEPVYLYLYGCYIADNITKTSSINRPGAFYCRENSHTAIVNTTITGNSGAACNLYVYSTSAKPADCYVVSSTISGNSVCGNGVPAGIAYMPTSSVYVYNSIVSGNTGTYQMREMSAWSTVSSEKIGAVVGSINDKQAIDAAGSPAGSFDPSTMLGACKDGVIPCTGSSNPALTAGMSVSELKMISTGYPVALDAAELSVDQKGNERVGKVMGAYAGK